MDPDRIPSSFLLHDQVSVLASPFLYNLSLQYGILPDILKEPEIVPIHKEGHKENVRPILMSEKQRKFIRNQSTVSICITQFIAHTYDTYAQVYVLYIDFCKTF